MLQRVYLFAGTMLLAGYAACELAGWEFSNPLRVSPAPPPDAVVTRPRAGFGGGRSAAYSHGYSSSTRGGPGVGGPTGGK